jgi:hypothetical protein
VLFAAGVERGFDAACLEGHAVLFAVSASSVSAAVCRARRRVGVERDFDSVPRSAACRARRRGRPDPPVAA